MPESVPPSSIPAVPAQSESAPSLPSPSLPAEQAAPPSEAKRAAPLTSIDVFRGLTIIEVVLHHASGMALRYLTPGSQMHELVALINRTLHFAVPAFVFLSAVVLTRSLLKRFAPGRYFSRRLTRGAWPYLLWSGLYMLWYVWTGQRPASTLTDPDKVTLYLLYGKASYHLYFLLVALQVYVLIPLLLPLARLKPSISLTLLVGAAVQMGAYFLNRSELRLPFPASSVLWYLLPVLVGMAVGARLDEFPAWWRRRRAVILPLLLASFAWYLPAAMSYVRGTPVSSLDYNAASWAFTTLMAVTLLGAAQWIQGRPSPIRTGLALLGTVSLQIYLLHPALLQWLERRHAPAGTSLDVALLSAAYALTALLLPALLGRLLLKGPLGRVSTLLFGR
ncbi:acyltransferase [Deinococcus knuensis]|uniref:Acyltransferase n=1 Tax=Deinococcus knuensis TaxID=1837380 RepID=A0ABQ2SEU6_9DEIO|nr:acyltransferase [Deinococcus knuensis]GGS24165.1 acyltransferase [Deinococcus knuensis]